MSSSCCLWATLKYLHLSKKIPLTPNRIKMIRLIIIYGYKNISCNKMQLMRPRLIFRTFLLTWNGLLFAVDFLTTVTDGFVVSHIQSRENI